jgi:hypothetical protein
VKGKVLQLVAAGVALALLSGCGGGSGSGGASGSTSTFEATVAGARRQSGKLSVTIDARVGSSVAFVPSVVAADAVTASGTLTLVRGGGTASLAGTYSPSGRTLELSGGGFTFTGTVGADGLNGTYTGAGGGGGTFTGADASAGAARVFCGSYSGTRFGTGSSDGPMGGVFNMVISSNGSITGIALDDLGVASHIAGTLSGDSISITAGGAVIHGTLSGDTASGTFSDKNSTGTWQGTRV